MQKNIVLCYFLKAVHFMFIDLWSTIGRTNYAIFKGFLQQFLKAVFSFPCSVKQTINCVYPLIFIEKYTTVYLSL